MVLPRSTSSGASYQNNPLVVNKGMSINEAKALDEFGKGGGLVDGELIREFPVRRNSTKRRGLARL